MIFALDNHNLASTTDWSINKPQESLNQFLMIFAQPYGSGSMDERSLFFSCIAQTTR